MARGRGRLWTGLVAGCVVVCALSPPARSQPPRLPAPGPQAAATPPSSGDAAAAPAQTDQGAQPPRGEDILNLDIEQLSRTPVRVPSTSTSSAAGASGSPAFDVPVSTVSRISAPQTGTAGATVGQSPAAVYVITQEDIRRSGMRSIPDALRMVPGLEVARLDSNKWAITSRGFNGRFADKLLVLIDGRTVYTPLFSGVYWDERDTMLEDIERIEVIRGPGATLWGANAVNGVINIITKKAQDTQGGLLVGGGGSYDRGFGAIRYGGKLNDEAYYRFYVNYFNRDRGENPAGGEAADAWQVTRGGFRIDWNPGSQDTFLCEGDIYYGDLGDTLTVPTLTVPYQQTFNEKFNTSGGYLLGRWTHVIANDSDVSLQVYWDRTHRSVPALLREIRDTIDLDWQYRFPLSPRQEVVCGLGYRLTSDDITNSETVAVNPTGRTDNLFSSYVQDDVTLIPEQLHFIVGTKLEHNDYTGFEVQPGARLLWTPDKRQTVWASVARAVRTPSRIEADGRINNMTIPPNASFPGSPLTLATFFGDHQFESEELTAYEAGYRVSATERLSLDFAGFFNDYDDLRTLEPRAPFLEVFPTPLHLTAPFFVENRLHGYTHGIEVAASWKASDRWTVNGGYTWLQMNLIHDPGSRDVTNPAAEGIGPHNQFHVRSYFDLSRCLQLDTALYYVDNLPAQGIPSYFRLDVRLGWKPRENVEVVLGGQNLLEPRHLEFASSIINTLPTPAERSVYGLVRWRF